MTLPHAVMFERALASIGGLFGAAGVGLMALAAHGRWPSIDYAAIMVLSHAVAFVAIAAAMAAGLLRRGPARLAAVALILSVALFSADVTLHALAGESVFPMAAPLGGTGAILGWLLLAVAGLVPSRAAGRP